MFLFNIFGKSDKQIEEQKYDRISFKINVGDNVPQFHEWQGEEPYREEEELTPEHPLYYEIFPKKEEKFVEYLVTENDTVFGIAIKLDISEQSLRAANNISGDLYPGMRIKLPMGADVGRLTENRSEKAPKVRISQLLKPSEKAQEYNNAKYSVSYYAGLSGYIKGQLTLNLNYLIFNPSLDDHANTHKFAVQRLLKFNAIIETMDVQDITLMEIPEMRGDSEEPKVISVIQFMLYRVGNAKIEKKYKERLKQLKIDRKAIASVSFSIADTKEKRSKDIGLELIAKIKEIIGQSEAKPNEVTAEIDEKSRLTNIPFFDIIHENIQPKSEESEIKEELNKVIKQSAILGNLNEQSAIISPEEFSNLVVSFPVLYELYNWNKVYSSTRDGLSFNTMLNKCKNVEPALLLIKEYKGFRFGAFLIENLQTGKTGRGEMFIFTYKEESIIPEVYNWTGKNQTFVVCNTETGLGIGMGFKYGLFLKSSMDKGSSSSTVTFGNNAMLSKKEDFLVDQIEIWGIDSSY